MDLIKFTLKGILSAFAQEAISAENIQMILKMLIAKVKSLAEETDTKIDDVLLTFLDGIVTSADKADAIAQWIKDALIPNRCGSAKEEDLQETLGGSDDWMESAAWFTGVLLPIFVDFYAKVPDDEYQDK